MNIFLSWSGKRSRALAGALRDWLPDVLQVVEPWMSGKDLDPGKRWGQEVGKYLANSDFAILCVTEENARAPWVSFEAGACAKHLENAQVVPVLLDLRPGELPGPLGQFQAVQADKAGMRRLIRAVNEAAGELQIKDNRVERSFETWWPELQNALQEVELIKAPVPLNSSQLNIVEDFSEFLSAATEMINTAKHRFFVVRHYAGGRTASEETYFEATKTRLSTRELPDYRRLINITSVTNIAQIEWFLSELGSVEHVEIKAWNAVLFPTNYDLVIGDHKAILIFSPKSGGAPQRGIAIADRSMVDFLVDLFDRYWLDTRSVSIREQGSQTKKQQKEAVEMVKIMSQQLSA